MLELRNKAAKMADAGTTKLTNTRDRMSSQPSKNINWNAEIKPKPPPPPKPPKPLPPPSRTSPSTSSNAPSSSGTASGKPPAPPVPLRRAGSSATPPVPLSRSDSQLSYASSHSSTPPPPPARSVAAGPPAVPSGPPPAIRRDTRPDAAKPTQSTGLLPRITESRPEPEANIDRVDWAHLSPEDKEVFFSWLDEFFAHYFKKPVPPRSILAESAKHMLPGKHTPSPTAAPVGRCYSPMLSGG